MKPDDFESRLQRQTLRQLPREWRGEILAAAHAAQAPHQASRVTRHTRWSVLNQQFSVFFWPHPKAWAGLAAAWVCILALNLSTHEAAPALAKKSAPPSPEVIVELKKQQRMFAELVGSHATPDADRPRIFSPRPRSERAEILVT